MTNNKGDSSDLRQVYPLAVLNSILDATTEVFGPHDLTYFPTKISRNRALKKVIEGEINIYSAPSKPEWIEKTLPILIPIRKGLLGYRLLLIRKSLQNKLNNVNTVIDLQGLSLGQGSQWSSTEIFKRYGFSVVDSISYDSLFEMLANGRFDYFPRGISEIFDEYENRRFIYPNLTIEKNMALYMPLATYFYVSPKNPILRKRMLSGFRKIIDDGTFQTLFKKHNQRNIDQAGLANRKIINITNQPRPIEAGFNVTNLWYHP